MKNKVVTGEFTSFQDLAKAFGVKPPKRRTKNEEKLKAQQNKFLKKHVCPACGKPMEFQPGTNIMICSNPDCKGIKHVRTDEDGNEITTYTPSYNILDDRGTNIAENIF